MQTIVIRNKEGFYIKTLPNDFAIVKNWFRENSTLPSYTDHAKRFTLQECDSHTPVQPYDPSPEGKITFNQYANNCPE